MITINRDLLINYRFADSPNGWALEAKSIYDSAELLYQALRNPAPRESKFISMPDATALHMRLKTVCFFYSISIELFLKAIYSSRKTPEDQEKTESFKHDVVKLAQKLIAKGILKEGDLDEDTLKIANILLEWSGRYYRPNPKELERIIETHFEAAPNEDNMLKPKFSINNGTMEKLRNIASLLSKNVKVNPASIDHLLFIPF